MVYPAEDGHPSKYSPGLALINFSDQTNDANHYATPPTKQASILQFMLRREIFSVLLLCGWLWHLPGSTVAACSQRWGLMLNTSVCARVIWCICDAACNVIRCAELKAENS